MSSPVAEVVDYSIRVALGRVVVGVVVTCPNGCKVGRAGRPDTHSHGWTSLTANGGKRAAHCGRDGARGYRLRWPGGPPADVRAALEGVC